MYIEDQLIKMLSQHEEANIITAGYNLEDMMKSGFVIDLNSEHTPLEQAKIWEVSTAESEF